MVILWRFSELLDKIQNMGYSCISRMELCIKLFFASHYWWSINHTSVTKLDSTKRDGLEPSSGPPQVYTFSPASGKVWGHMAWWQSTELEENQF